MSFWLETQNQNVGWTTQTVLNTRLSTTNKWQKNFLQPGAFCQAVLKKFTFLLYDLEW